LAVVGLLLAISTAASAQVFTNGEKTTHEIVVCLDAEDQPICLLRFARSGSIFPLSFYPEFMDADDIVAEVERGVERGPPGEETGLGRALRRSSTSPLMRQGEAIDQALAADRAGASPRDALEPIRELAPRLRARSFIFGQIVTASGPQLRAQAYASIWRAYNGERAAVGGGLPVDQRPSLALARATVEAWERQWDRARLGSGGDFGRLIDLARAYEALGDSESAERVLLMDRDSAPGNRVTLAVEQGRLSDALSLLTTIEASDRYGSALRTMDAAVDAGQPEIASAAARIVLETSQQAISSAAAQLGLDAGRLHLPAMPRVVAVFARYGDRDDALRLAEGADREARGGFSRESAAAAIVAAAAWTELGVPERANALLTTWIVRIDPEVPGGLGCGRYAPLSCPASVVQQMLRRMDRLEEALDYGLSADLAMEADLEDGRGLARLETWLSRASSDADHDAVLTECIDWAIREWDLASSSICLRGLLETAAHRPLTEEDLARISDPLRSDIPRAGPHVSAEKALEVAALAARLGEFEAANTHVGEAVSTWRDAAPIPWRSQNSVWLQQVAQAQLRLQGRL
jgi:hypothetical protein